MSDCREKSAVHMRRYREKHKEKIAAYRASPVGRYDAHKNHALTRGIPWEFDFETWWAMWEPYWHNRGQGGDQYCMCRKGDSGPYSPENCRIDTGSANRRESAVNTLQRNNTSGVTGVVWNKGKKKWSPQIKVNGKRVYLGDFGDFFEAVCARKSAELKHGFHCLHEKATSMRGE